MPETPAGLLDSALRRDPAGPLLTYYDDATGERTELSALSLANWVAKTANLLRDDLDVEPGESVCLLLPAHWQTAVVLLAAWSLGALPVMTPAGVAVVVCDEPRLPDALAAGVRDVLGLSLRPLNARLSHCPPGVTDYAAEVLAAGDVFAATEPSGAVEVMAARNWAEEIGLAETDRVLVADAGGAEEALDWLLTPLAVGASIVLCHNADPTLLARRVEQERVTATMGVTLPGIRRLDSE